MEEQLDRIELKMDKIIKALNPLKDLDNKLRADIKHVLAGKLDNNKLPRKQPDGSAWKKGNTAANPLEFVGDTTSSEKVK